MIKALKVSVLATMMAFLSACGGTQVCLEAEPYEQSELGKHVEPPEGLDPLNPERELTIPEPSPRPPRAANAPCLELPPTFRIEEPPPQQAAEEADESEGA